MVGRLLLSLVWAMGLWAMAQGWELRVCADPNHLPYSNRQEEGFENKIARLLAEEIGARLVYYWYPQRPLLREVIREGECEVVIGVADGHPLFLNTIAYYRTAFVFVYRADRNLDLASLDDPVLRGLRIGVHVVPGGVNPPAQALANRGLLPNLVGFSVFGDYAKPNPLSEPVEAVVRGDIDVAIVWGPVGGYFAKRSPVPLKVVLVSPEIDPPFLPMVFSITVGVRKGDEGLRDLLNRAIVRRWEEIQEILAFYGVPLLPLPKPSL
jgi:mxaJ protein